MIKDPLCPVVSVEPPECYDPTAWAMDGDEPSSYVDTTVQDVKESIDTNLWLALAYVQQDAPGLARECARAALKELRRFGMILRVYAGPDFCDGARSRIEDLARMGVSAEPVH